MLRQVQIWASFVPFLGHMREIPEIFDCGRAVDFALANPFISPGQVRSEFMELAAIIQAIKPQAALEIGTLRGGTLFALCRLADPSATIISVDMPGGKFGGGTGPLYPPVFRKFVKPHQKLHLIKADSHQQQTKNKVESALRSTLLDYLFIDGDHSYEGVKQDFEMYSPLVRPGGVIAFHDIAPHKDSTCEVSRFWNQIKGKYESREIIENIGQGWAGIGIITA